MTIIIPKTNNPELKKFYAWWLKEAAKPQPLLTITDYGLCHAIGFYNEAVLGNNPYLDHGYKTRYDQQKLLEEYCELNAVDHRLTPFNAAFDYGNEKLASRCHHNPRRIAFVKAQLSGD